MSIFNNSGVTPSASGPFITAAFDLLGDAVPDFDLRGDVCADGQSPRRLSEQSSHLGPTGRQIICKGCEVTSVSQNRAMTWPAGLTWPKPTRSGLISGCSSLGSHDWRLSLHSARQDKDLLQSVSADGPCLFRRRRGRPMPAQSVGDTMHMNIDADAQVDIPRCLIYKESQLLAYDRRVQIVVQPGEAGTPSSVQHQVERTALPQSLGRQNHACL